MRELDAEDVTALRDELAEQLAGASPGLDEVPLRAFVAAADAYVASRSERFSGATLDTTSRAAPASNIPPQPAGDPCRCAAPSCAR